MLSHSVVSDSVTPQTVAHQAPMSTGLPRQEYWSELPFHPPGDLPDRGTEPESFAFPALAGEFFTTSTTWEAPHICVCFYIVFFFFLQLVSSLTMLWSEKMLEMISIFKIYQGLICL